MYASPHVWNLVAKMIRESLADEDELFARLALMQLALRFARRFSEDEGFIPRAWLNQCSPDVGRLDLASLWED